jgi:hypothetical protein
MTSLAFGNGAANSAESAPEEILAALTAFLAPYRDGRGAQSQDA